MFEKYFDKHDPKAKGLAVISIEPFTVVNMNYPGYNVGGVGINDTDTRIGYLTGYWTTQNGINWVQVIFESVMYYDDKAYYSGYVDASKFRTYKIEASSEGEKVVNGLIANNKEILENNLLCAGLISKMENLGIAVPVSYKKQLYALQLNLQERNEKILQNEFISSKQTETPIGFERYGNDLQSFMNNPKIGVAPVVVYIVASVVIAFLVSGILYLIFKPDYTDSKADLVVSKDLTKALSTLSPEARAAVLADLEGQVDKAYVNGKMSGSGMGMLKTVGYFAAGVVGFVLIDKFIRK